MNIAFGCKEMELYAPFGTKRMDEELLRDNGYLLANYQRMFNSEAIVEIAGNGGSKNR
jgi:hypothetical protein